MSDNSHMKHLLILGAGQYGCVTKETAECMGYFEKIDFLDDNFSKALGPISDYALWSSQYQQAIVAIGNSQKRLELTEQLRQAGFRIATIISPKAYVSCSAVIQEGCVIEALSVVNSNAVLGECCIVSAGAIVNHNAILGEGVHIDCNAIIGSNVTIPPLTKVEYGKVVSLV